MAPLFDLTGKIALITGSSRGIGAAIARGLAEAGATVVLNSRSAADVDRAKVELSGLNRPAYGYAFDVTDQKAVASAVDRIEEEVGPIDILFNNAGIQRRAPLEQVPAETWREVMATNVDSVFFVGQAVARHMIPRQRGKIVNTCSLASEIARPSIAPYVTAKGAVKMLTKAMCGEWAKHNIQVNGIGPGYFKTELNRALFTDQAFDEWVRKRTPSGRWGEVEELVGVALLLASPASSYINGQVIYVDGGLTAVM
ncbi:MAG TPA: glucose 1-dehydrogenase [Bauldia sp.]|nr:glucose 1-dehydrogenase [Bauldia sp.]